jgi:hypothetical protein
VKKRYNFILTYKGGSTKQNNFITKSLLYSRINSMVHNYFYSFISILLIVVYETQCIAIRSHFSPVNMLNLISNVAGSPGVSQLLQNPQLAKLKEFVSQTPSTDSSAETQPNPVDEKEAAILQFLKNLTPEDIQSMNSEAGNIQGLI